MTMTAGETRVRFDLQGNRQHVRATDVLAVLQTRFPDRPLTVKFARPLSGPALLQSPARAGAAVVGRAGPASFSLDPDPDTPALRRGADRTPAIRLGFGPSDIFAFWPGVPLSSRIAAIFDQLHPRQTQRFLVRQITLHPGPVRRGPVLVSRLTIDPDRGRARLHLTSPLGRLATLDFHLIERDPALALPQSTE